MKECHVDRCYKAYKKTSPSLLKIYRINKYAKTDFHEKACLQ
jgi:hypothetical protein